jgi:hypothetical protein
VCNTHRVTVRLNYRRGTTEKWLGDAQAYCSLILGNELVDTWYAFVGNEAVGKEAAELVQTGTAIELQAKGRVARVIVSSDHEGVGPACVLQRL